MTVNEFIISPNASIEKFDEGSLIVDDGAQTVACLGKFETSILEMLLAKGKEDTIRILKQQYNDDRINSDVDEFCSSLLSQKIIVRK